MADHPRTVNLREDHVTQVINEWIGHLFAPHNVDETVSTLVGDQRATTSAGGAEVAKARRADAEQRLRRHREAIEAGIDPLALVEAVNQAQADRAAAQAEIERGASGGVLDRAEVYAMIDSLGDIGATLADGKPASLARLYKALDLAVRYEPAERAVYLTARPRVDSGCVRGGT
ncbi:hypothetical protein [Pseudonocardia parietis]|uniref:hypothetical protein n=1 Tax=Pseudonocardia parietis TaxID=570936 RepID=UPI001FD924E8